MSRLRLAGLVAVFCLPPAVLALASDHLAREPGLLMASTTCAALAVGALAIQPLLAARGGRAVHDHRVLGTAIVVLVLAHVGTLLVLAPDDALFAMSPDGPTRARMALIATIALLVAAVLGATGRGCRCRGRRGGSCTPTWRPSSSSWASATPCSPREPSTGPGTPLLLALGAVGVLGRGRRARRRRARRRPRPRWRSEDVRGARRS
jgi:hypothetical protein